MLKFVNYLCKSILHSMPLKLLMSCLIAIAMVLTIHSFSYAQPVTNKLITRTSVAVPGTGPGVSFTTFHSFSINDAGDSVIQPVLTGPGITGNNNQTIYSVTTGNLELVASGGVQAPNAAPGQNFEGFGVPVINESGKIAFAASLKNIGITNGLDSIYLDSAGNLELIALTGEQAPGTTQGTIFERFLGPLISDTGQVTFRAFLDGPNSPNTDWGLFSYSNNNLRLVARNGVSVPSLGPDVTLKATSIVGTTLFPAISNTGQIVFSSEFQGSGVDGTNNHGIFSDLDGTLSLVVREGDSAPGTGGNLYFKDFFSGSLTVNDVGNVAFKSVLSDTNSDYFGIYSQPNGLLNLVARSGDFASGIGTGVFFQGFGNPEMNNTGQVAFKGFLSGNGVGNTNDEGIFAESSSALDLIARKGDLAPDIGSGVLFGDLFDPLINDFGQVAFNTELTGPGVDNNNDRAIFATDSMGALRLVAREGDMLDFNPNPNVTDLKTILFVSHVSGSSTGGINDGMASSFNNNGELIFWVRFTDGTEGIYKAQFGIVPEPHGLIMVLTVLCFGFSRTRR